MDNTRDTIEGLIREEQLALAPDMCLFVGVNAEGEVLFASTAPGAKSEGAIEAHYFDASTDAEALAQALLRYIEG